MRHIILMVIFAALSSMFGCGNSPTFKVGALYSVEDGEGAYQVAKVLAVEDQGVHVRVYKNRFSTRPTQVDITSLSIGTIHDKDGFGMGHLPLTHNAFSAWAPRFLKDHSVTEDELDGYREFKSAGGQFFDGK
jgi:hypothetical protein